jgi:hypothetical protein
MAAKAEGCVIKRSVEAYTGRQTTPCVRARSATATRLWWVARDAAAAAHKEDNVDLPMGECLPQQQGADRNGQRVMSAKVEGQVIFEVCRVGSARAVRVARASPCRQTVKNTHTYLWVGAYSHRKMSRGTTSGQWLHWQTRKDASL